MLKIQFVEVNEINILQKQKKKSKKICILLKIHRKVEKLNFFFFFLLNTQEEGVFIHHTFGVKLLDTEVSQVRVSFLRERVFHILANPP